MTGIPREGEIFDGKYRIGPLLGIGGMATVVAANHIALDQRVAIKFLLPDCAREPDLVERFMREGQAATKIRSEHVVRILDVGVAAGTPYLVMEYLDGSDLSALVARGGPLPVEPAVDLLLQASEAIGEAHVLGIIHRDLKPANLFLTHRADGSPCAKVLDFGISKMRRTGPLFESNATLPTAMMGSPNYMPPEQMESATAVDARSDVWSLGTILYEVLAGKPPFDAPSITEVCARVLRMAPPPLARVRKDVPPGLEAVLLHCLEKEPSRRYANVAELARALAPFGSSAALASAETITRVVEGGAGDVPASRPSMSTIPPTAGAILARADSRARRRVSGYLMGSLLALGTLGGIIGSVLGYQRSFDPPDGPSALRAARSTPVASGMAPSVAALPRASSGAPLVAASVAAFTSSPTLAITDVPLPAPPTHHHHHVKRLPPRPDPSTGPGTGESNPYDTSNASGGDAEITPL